MSRENELHGRRRCVDAGRRPERVEAPLDQPHASTTGRSVSGGRFVPNRLELEADAPVRGLRVGSVPKWMEEAPSHGWPAF
jgi:hypothetical protein